MGRLIACALRALGSSQQGGRQRGVVGGRIQVPQGVALRLPGLDGGLRLRIGVQALAQGCGRLRRQTAVNERVQVVFRDRRASVLSGIHRHFIT